MKKCWEDPSWESVFYLFLVDFLLFRSFILIKTFHEEIVESRVGWDLLFLFVFYLLWFLFSSKGKEVFDEGNLHLKEDSDEPIGPNYKVPYVLAKNKELFEREYNRNLELMKFGVISASGSFGVCIAILSAYVFILNNLGEIKNSSEIERVVFFSAFGAGGVFTLNGIYYVMRSLMPEKVYKVTSPKEFGDGIEEIWEEYDDTCLGKEEKEELERQYQEDLDYEIVKSYISYGEIALDINNKRFNDLGKSRKLIFYSLQLLLFCSLLFFLLKENYEGGEVYCFLAFCVGIHFFIRECFEKEKLDEQ